jgi:hypothetical protein
MANRFSLDMADPAWIFSLSYPGGDVFPVRAWMKEA